MITAHVFAVSGDGRSTARGKRPSDLDHLAARIKKEDGSVNVHVAPYDMSKFSEVELLHARTTQSERDELEQSLRERFKSAVDRVKALDEPKLRLREMEAVLTGLSRVATIENAKRVLQVFAKSPSPEPAKKLKVVKQLRESWSKAAKSVKVGTR